MSWTDDMEKLKVVADKIAAGRDGKGMTPCLAKPMENTYYEKRTHTSAEHMTVLHEYVASTPIELRKQIEQIWKINGKSDMLDLAPICMISAARCRPKQGEIGKGREVSQYVYEF